MSTRVVPFLIPCCGNHAECVCEVSLEFRFGLGPEEIVGEGLDYGPVPCPQRGFQWNDLCPESPIPYGYYSDLGPTRKYTECGRLIQLWTPLFICCIEHGFEHLGERDIFHFSMLSYTITCGTETTGPFVAGGRLLTLVAPECEGVCKIDVTAWYIWPSGDINFCNFGGYDSGMIGWLDYQSLPFAVSGGDTCVPCTIDGQACAAEILPHLLPRVHRLDESVFPMDDHWMPDPHFRLVFGGSNFTNGECEGRPWDTWTRVEAGVQVRREGGGTGDVYVEDWYIYGHLNFLWAGAGGTNCLATSGGWENVGGMGQMSPNKWGRHVNDVNIGDATTYEACFRILEFLFEKHSETWQGSDENADCDVGVATAKILDIPNMEELGPCLV